MLLESGKPGANPFAALMGGGQREEKDEFGRPKSYRHVAVGAVLAGTAPEASRASGRDAATAAARARESGRALAHE
jgi:hypothetical protein